MRSRSNSAESLVSRAAATQHSSSRARAQTAARCSRGTRNAHSLCQLHLLLSPSVHQALSGTRCSWAICPCCSACASPIRAWWSSVEPWARCPFTCASCTIRRDIWRLHDGLWSSQQTRTHEQLAAQWLQREPGRGQLSRCLTQSLIGVFVCPALCPPAVVPSLSHSYPHTLTAQYQGSEYTGENILHIAIINQDFASVRWLMSRPGGAALLTARATGRFFQEGSACAYGEYPLAFACCTNQPEIASYLLSHGADLEAVDSRGNNLLHLLVIHNLPDMYMFVKNEFKKRAAAAAAAARKEGSSSSGSSPAKAPPPPSARPRLSRNPSLKSLAHPDLWLRVNHDGLTPFCLAAKIDSSAMFTFLLQETKQRQWSFGPVSCDLYPLAELDLAISDGEKERAGALELLMNAGNVNLIMHPRMLDLVAQKWEKFAARIFHRRFRHVLAYLCLFTLTTIVRQTVRHIAEKEEALASAAAAAASATSTADSGSSPFAAAAAAAAAEPYLPWALFVYNYPVILWLMYAAVLAGAWSKGHAEFLEMWRSGFWEYFSSSGSALLENTLSCTFCGCIFLVTVLAAFDHPAQSAVLALASLAGWSYLFFFLLAWRLTGPMIVMIAQMLTNDVLRFLVIYLVFLMGFAQAFFVLFESVGWSGFVQAVQTCFVAMLGDFDLDRFADSPYTAVSVGLLVVYVVTITILLLNLLIAMMGDTFDKINEAAEMQWHLERARIVFALENELSKEEREDPSNKYW